nr:phenylalanine--tRNA ligase subunit beta [Chitinophagaceae bacterium]
YCIGQGFFEMMTNSITNAAYFSEKEQSEMVKMKNSLSAAFNILRPSLFETSMEVVAHNLNHKNNNLRLFEFGKAYHTKGIGKYTEEKKLCFVLTGHKNENSWQQKMLATDFFALKGLLEAVGKLLGISEIKLVNTTHPKLADAVHIMQGQKILGEAGSVNQQTRQQFGIKQPVYFAELNWTILTQLASQQEQKVKEINKFPAVQRDLAVLVSKNLSWQNLKETVESMQLKKLQHVKLFDIFESDKLGKDKKSLAVNFVFQDEEKTLTDKEIDKWMQSIMSALEKNLQAEIRK